MGNCLVVEEKVVRVMKTDGKILEYKTPIKAHQVLSQFSSHAISDALPVVRYLNPSDDLRQKHLYYLLPLPVQSVTKTKKKKNNNNNKRVRFADDVAKEEAEQETAVVRIKLMISKQELQAMLLRDGGVLVDEMISRAQIEPSDNGLVTRLNSDGNVNPGGWVRSLEILQEVQE